MTPEQSTARRFVESGLCPFCEAGPFVLLAGHTNKAHGIDRFQLRDCAGLPYSAVICDPAHSAACSENVRQRPFTDEDRRKAHGGKRRISQYARAADLEKLHSWRETVGESAYRASRRAGGRASAEKTARPHPCPTCGEVIPRSRPMFCSAACRLRERSKPERPTPTAPTPYPDGAMGYREAHLGRLTS